MRHHQQSLSTIPPASTVLPSATIIPLSPVKHKSEPATQFTKKTIHKMHCPSGKTEAFFWDASCRGFGLRALKSGQRSWIFQYRDEHRRTRRIVLGDVTAVGLDAARDAARKYAAAVAQGGNPAVQRKQRVTVPKLVDVVEAYLRHAKNRLRPRSYEETERHLRQHAAPLHHERVETLHRRDINGLLDRVAQRSGATAANRLRAALSAMWSWGLLSGLIDADANPVSYTVRQVEKPRERTLTDNELVAIWSATADGGDYSRIVRLCMLTGCRREEIGGLHRHEVQPGWLVIPADRMKGGAIHEVPVLPLISATLPERVGNSSHVFGRRGNGFSGWSKSKNLLDARLAKLGIPIPPWRLHDLRRTFSTKLHDAGVEPLVIEALLAHKQQGVAAVYNRASFREAKQAALARWHSILTTIFEGVAPVTSDGI
jgi:integrase